MGVEYVLVFGQIMGDFVFVVLGVFEQGVDLFGLDYGLSFWFYQLFQCGLVVWQVGCFVDVLVEEFNDV